MMKKTLGAIMAISLVISMTACGGLKDTEITPPGDREESRIPDTEAAAVKAEEAPAQAEDDAEDFRIGIVTGSFSQSEDDRRGAEAFQKKYGEDRVTLAIYPDNFTDEFETTVGVMTGLADDPKMKAIVVNQAVEGTEEAFKRIKERRPDILCIAGETFDVFEDIKDTADLVVNNDFVSRGYLIIRTAHELGCDTFVHISFPRHLSYETYARRVNIMKAACEEFGMEFAMEEAPDPTTEVGVPGAQEYITRHVPEWVEKYGKNSAYFCTNDAHTEPLIKGLLENGGYFIEADLPSPIMGYPGALDLNLTGADGDFDKITAEVEKAVVAAGGAGRFGTWTSSYGFTNSAGLAEHARNVIMGKSELTDLNAIREAYKIYTPRTEWNGSKYTNAETGEVMDNVFLVYQDTYIFGDPGRYMGVTKVNVPEEYFTIK
ncbi:MAG: DUF3798 domain-containing protein [Lachnospiraceae bacterium]|nr:DUF3798 domain-containing protein [Lachnospiraceae bacterium]